MKTKVSQSSCYDLEVDYTKNRVYLTILKKWSAEDGNKEFSDFSLEWQTIISKITVDFTIICDVRLMPVLSRQMVEVFENMQEYVTKNGLCHLAEIVAEDDIPNLQMARISERSGIPLSRFQSYELADKYLDKFLEECI
ncbi:hypothetical protein WAF17_04505 [Bernardetia sp. ABR2-2B]|uniref:hypothetical protein n=1 Tax=Bernardetia sp. ABR2-2B TaxID=3127472 RepID=UPI0030D0B729